MDNIEIDKKDLHKAIRLLLLSTGFNIDEVNSCIRSWQYAEDSKKYTHGYERLTWLIDIIEKKKVLPNSKFVITKNKFFNKVEGVKTLGYISAYKAVDLSIDSAKKLGIGISTISDCYPTGCIGEYTEEIASNGLIGFAVSSSPPRVSAFNTSDRIYSTLGHSFSFPGTNYNYVYDSSVGAITHGEVQLAKKMGIKLPSNSVMNKNGDFTIDPEELFDDQGTFNGIINIAGGENSKKISGLAGSLELLARLAIIDSDKSPEGYSIFIALDPSIFGDMTSYKLLVDSLQEKIKNARKQTGVKESFYAGESSFNNRLNSKETVEISKKTFNLLESYL